MTPRIAFLACPDTLPGSPTRRPDAFEHDLQIGALRDGLAGRAEVLEFDWRAPLEQLAQCRIALIGTAWDYTDHPAEFLSKLEALQAAGVQVCNPPEVVRWNADKHYLAELAERGAPSIPTLWHDGPDAEAIAAAFDHFGCDRLVVKRRVGAGAVGQFSFVRGDPALAGWRMDQPAMIQPFLPAIQTEGELSLLFIGGAFSHALWKRAVPGDYRIQSLYGGTEHAVRPEPHDLARAEAVMAMLPFDQAPLNARIDMVRGADGEMALIEAELIEPYLYPLQDPGFGARLAEAVLARIGALPG